MSVKQYIFPMKLTLTLLLIEYKKSVYLNEVFQDINVQFSFVTKQKDGHYRQIHTTVKCRDFLGDCIWSKKIGLPMGIYGFKYNYKDTYRLSCSTSCHHDSHGWNTVHDE